MTFDPSWGGPGTHGDGPGGGPQGECAASGGFDGPLLARAGAAGVLDGAVLAQAGAAGVLDGAVLGEAVSADDPEAGPELLGVITPLDRPCRPPVAARALLDAVERFRARDKDRSPAETLEELILIRRACDRLDLEFAEAAARFARTDEFDTQGYVSPIACLRDLCHLSGHAAVDRLCVGRQMPSLPQSVAATRDGALGFQHLALLARTTTALAEADPSRPVDERPLLRAAQDSSVAHFQKVCMHARHAGDPAGFAADERLLVEARRLHLKPGEGGELWIRGLLDPEGGAALRSALEPLARRSGRDDDRCRERRLADALVEFTVHALDSGALPQHRGQRPHLQVTASLDTLRGLAGACAGDLEFSLPVSGEAVRRLACDSTLTRVVLGAQSAVIDVGRATRVIPPAIRRAVTARDRGCVWPGCDRPASWTQVHHVIHWGHRGATEVPNLVLLCLRHHHLAHEGGWQLVRTDQGRILTVPPPLDLSPLARAPALRGP